MTVIYAGIGHDDMSNNDKLPQSNLNAALLVMALDRASPQPLHLQLSDNLRALVLTGRFAGERLPASRIFAKELSVSRMTVTSAYDQLIAEGYLLARRGDGTYIAQHLPHLVTATPTAIAPPPEIRPYTPFHPGIPDQAGFPHRLWARHLERVWRRPDPRLLAQSDPLGWYELRAAIAAHMAAWRELDCVPAQVVITAGAWDGMDILRGAGLLAGKNLALEDPGWPALRQIVEQAGCRPTPLRIDAEGLDPADIPADTRTVLVTPSRHYPTGTVMPLTRRLELLHWADRQSGIIIEDDYDSEFRYQGHPLPSLAGLDGLSRVVYMGSFSKLFSPGLRIGYIVLPEPHLQAVQEYLAMRGARASMTPQPALAAFMESGEFAIHLRRMRRIYARRQAVLLQELQPVANLLGLQTDGAGMHLCLPLRPALARIATDRDIAEQGSAHGLTLRALSAHATRPEPPQGLLLGYAGFSEQELADSAQVLVGMLHAIAGD